MIEIVPSNGLVGRVVGGDNRGLPLNLKLNNRGFAALGNKLTDFGTTTPLERVGGFFDFFKAMMTIKGKKK